jgi:hypothetical protein
MFGHSGSTMSLPRTRAESSDYQHTSTHTDVMAFIAALAARRDASLWLGDFGRSPEGRTLPLMVLSAHQYFTPELAHASGLPVLLIIAGIHAGEVEGKEAVLMLVRDLLDGVHGDLLSKLTLVVAPLFNPDGNDRISPENRKLDIANFAGQLGPESGVGTRVNAAGINLNRDYMCQQAPEMQLLQARVCQPWNAHMTIDCHATNGSIHRFGMTFDTPHTVHSGRHEPIAYMREKLLPQVQAQVKAKDGFDSFYYGNFQRDEGGQGAGWITYTHHPRFGGNYRGLCNRLDLLLEAYSYISFAERVQVTYGFLRESMQYLGAHGDEVVSLLAECMLPPERIAVRYALEAYPDQTATVLTREPYTLSGAPISVQVPYIGCFVPEHIVARPRAYAMPPEIAAHLKLHGLNPYLPASDAPVAVEVAIISGAIHAAGRSILEAADAPFLSAEYTRQMRPIPPGWCLVDCAVQRGAIAVYLCEAGSDDGLVAAGVITAPSAGAEFPVWRVL